MRSRVLIAKWLVVFVCVQTRASLCERQHLWLFRYAPDRLVFFACSSAILFITSRWATLQKQNTTVDLQSHTGSTRNHIHTALHWLLSDQLARGRCFLPQCTHLCILPPLLSVSGYCFLPARSLLVCLSHYSTFCPAVIVDLNDIKGSAVCWGISCCVLMIREHAGVWLLIRCVCPCMALCCVCVQL